MPHGNFAPLLPVCAVSLPPLSLEETDSIDGPKQEPRGVGVGLVMLVGPILQEWGRGASRHLLAGHEIFLAMLPPPPVLLKSPSPFQL